jgi:hypothetical protein
MKLVVAILGLMLVFVIGANLLAPVNNSISVITTATYSAPVVSLSALLPLFFVVGLILGAVKGLDFAM